MSILLTEGQGRVLDAVSLLSIDGWPCSVREIAEAAGYQSTSTVHAHLLNLEALGLIRRGPRARAGWLPMPAVPSAEPIAEDVILEAAQAPKGTGS